MLSFKIQGKVFFKMPHDSILHYQIGIASKGTMTSLMPPAGSKEKE
jgi:hypothetical protein